MEWFLLASVVVGSLVVFIYHMGLGAALDDVSKAELTNKRAHEAGNARLLGILSREVANELMERDVEKYQLNFKKIYGKWEKIQSKDTCGKRALLGELSAKYESISEWGSMDDFYERPRNFHVLYADSFSQKSDEELWEQYL